MKKRVIKGQIISPGVAKGEVCLFNFTFTSPSSKDNLSGSDADEEIARFEKEVDYVINELEEAVKKLQKDSFFEEAEIIQFHIFLMKDARFHRRVHEKIKTNRPVAEVALEYILQELLEVLDSSESLVFSQRAADVKDIVTGMKKKLTKEDSVIFNKSLKDVNNPVLTTKELFPSLVLEAKKEGVNAFIVEKGTSLSHAAILAKSFGLPVLKVENLYSLGLRNSIEVFVDAINGKVVINPHEDEIIEASGLTLFVVKWFRTFLLIS
jgi:phosphotransferase system enzyme I (PtsI)